MTAAIVWFRNDLRLADHPALLAGFGSGRPVIPVYILDEESEGIRAPGAASRWWLHHSLTALSKSLEAIGGRLDVLPTGRNFYSLDNRTVPTPTAWNLGQKSAEDLVLRHFQDMGQYPKALGLSACVGGPASLGGEPPLTPASRYALQVETGLDRIALAVEAPRALVNVRLLVLRHPDKATEILLAFLPFADDDSVEEVRTEPQHVNVGVAGRSWCGRLARRAPLSGMQPTGFTDAKQTYHR